MCCTHPALAARLDGAAFPAAGKELEELLDELLDELLEELLQTSTVGCKETRCLHDALGSHTVVHVKACNTVCISCLIRSKRTAAVVSMGSAAKMTWGTGGVAAVESLIATGIHISTLIPMHRGELCAVRTLL